MPTVSSDLRDRDESPVNLATTHPADQATIDAAHAAYLRALRERDAAAAELSEILEGAEHYGLERADERRTDASLDLAEAGETLLSALGYGLPTEPQCACGRLRSSFVHVNALGHEFTTTAPRPGTPWPGASTGARALVAQLATRTVWNQHTNDIGDHCPYSGEPVDDRPGEALDEECPQGCQASVRTVDEG